MNRLPVSAWFGPEQQPWEPGRYEREWDSGGTRWAWWDGTRWSMGSTFAEVACHATNREIASGRQGGRWRGLAHDPAVERRFLTGLARVITNVSFGKIGGARRDVDAVGDFRRIVYGPKA